MSLSHLRQSGFRLELGVSTVYVDPYLSDSLERLHGFESDERLVVECHEIVPREAESGHGWLAGQAGM